MITRQIEGGRMDGMRLKHIRTLLAGLALIVAGHAALIAAVRAWGREHLLRGRDQG